MKDLKKMIKVKMKMIFIIYMKCIRRLKASKSEHLALVLEDIMTFDNSSHYTAIFETIFESAKYVQQIMQVVHNYING